MDGNDTTIKIASVEFGKPWRKPNTNQVWWTITTEDNTSEPSKFVQDEDKNIPKPEVGKEYKGRMFGNKFYPSDPNAPRGGYKGGAGNGAARAKQDADKQAEIKAEWAIARAMNSYSTDQLEKIEELAVQLFAMVDRVKVSNLQSPKAEAPERVSDNSGERTDEPRVEYISSNQVKFLGDLLEQHGVTDKSDKLDWFLNNIGASPTKVLKTDFKNVQKMIEQMG